MTRPKATSRIVSIGISTIGAEINATDRATFRAAAARLYGSALVAERYAAFGAFV